MEGQLVLSILFHRMHQVLRLLFGERLELHAHSLGLIPLQSITLASGSKLSLMPKHYNFREALILSMARRLQARASVTIQLVHRIVLVLTSISLLSKHLLLILVASLDRLLE